MTGHALRESERFAYSTLNAFTKHIAVLDESGTIILVNNAWRNFAFANSPTQEKLNEGANYLEMCDRAKGRGAQDALAFAAGIRAVLDGESAEFALEYACDSPTEQRWFIGRVTSFNVEGPTRVMVAHEDITARKLAEQQLKQSEEWLRAIFEASRDGILVEDDERIFYINQAYATLFGYSDPEELIGQHVSVVLSPDDEARLMAYGRRRVLGEAAPSLYEFKGKRKDGTLVDLEASVSVSAIAGKHYVTTAIREITERKQAEEALRQARDELERRVVERTTELARAIEALQGEIAERGRAEETRTELLRRLVTAQEDERRRIARELHDQMGQHLTAMMMGIKSLKDSGRWEPPADERFRQLQELGDILVDEIKTLAWELRPTVLDDLGLYTALSNYVEKWTERSGVPVDFHCSRPDERRLPPQVETAVYRIVQEATTNVLKHAQASRVSLILELRSDHVFVVVEDNGKGFDVEAALKESVSKRRMGLLGMRERVALVGGRLNIESSEGMGATMFVRIPVTACEKGECIK